MRKKIDEIERVGINFKKEMDEIKRMKFRNGTADPTDRKTFSCRRISSAVVRHPSWRIIKKDIVATKLDNDLEDLK